MSAAFPSVAPTAIPPRPSSRFRILRRLALTLFLLYAAIATAVYFLQDNLLFVRRRFDLSSAPALLTRIGAETITFTTPDGAELHAYWSKPKGQTRCPIVFYFGGNGENVLRRMADHEIFHRAGYGFLATSYRGYGASSGEPSVARFLSDALLIHDTMMARPDVDPSHAVAYGLSLGSGVALHLAAERQLPGLVLIAPYPTLSAAAKARYGWLPIDLLFRHRLDAASLAARTSAQTLIFHGEDDTTIPLSLGRALASSFPSPPTFHSLPHRGHIDVESWPPFNEHLLAHLTKLRSSAAPSPK